MKRVKEQKSLSQRLTISLGPNQRQQLEAIARSNHTSLAFVIRYGLERFIAETKDKQLRLKFPT
jgi:hypothetical protein